MANHDHPIRIIIISGMSGSGKTVALHVLEDLGYYCIDNFPAALLGSMIEKMFATEDSVYARMAVGIDARNRASDLESMPSVVAELRAQGIRCDVVFLTSSDDILLKRYSETRRKHPLSTPRLSLQDAIARERKLLSPIIDCADLTIDTTSTTIYELRDAIGRRVGSRQDPGLSILIQSFGYKHGVPADADFVFDLRCLPNPYWEPALRPLTGRHPEVARFLEASASVRQMYQDIFGFLDKWIPHYINWNRNYLTVALGCTGGLHRSVYMAEKIAAALGPKYGHVLARHHELPPGDVPDPAAPA